MEDCSPTTFASDSVYRRTVGRPRKYACAWFTANKRIYLTEETLEKLRTVKTRDGLGSDDAAESESKVVGEQSSIATLSAQSPPFAKT